MSELEQLFQLIRKYQNIDCYGYTRLVLYDDGSGHLERSADGSMFDRQAFISWNSADDLRAFLRAEDGG